VWCGVALLDIVTCPVTPAYNTASCCSAVLHCSAVAEWFCCSVMLLQCGAAFMFEMATRHARLQYRLMMQCAAAVRCCCSAVLLQRGAVAVWCSLYVAHSHVSCRPAYSNAAGVCARLQYRRCVLQRDVAVRCCSAVLLQCGIVVVVVRGVLLQYA